MKKLIKITTLTLLLLLLIPCVLAGCSKPTKAANEEDAMVTYTDMVGRKVTIKKDVERIALLRAMDINYLAVLLKDELPKKLVCTNVDFNDMQSDYVGLVEKYPDLKKVKCTSGDIYDDTLNTEEIINLAPDVVIVDKFFENNQYIKKFEDAGIPVLFTDLSSDSFYGPQKSLELIGKVLGKEDKAKEIIDFCNERIDRIVKTVDTIKTEPPTVYLENGGTGVDGNVLGDTYGGIGNPPEYLSWGTVLDKLKVKNIADGVIPSQQEPISNEYLLKSDPDIIVITGRNWATDNTMLLGPSATKEEAMKRLQLFCTRPGWSDLKAVKNKQVYSVYHVSSDLFNFASISLLAKAFYPEEFNDFNPEEDLKEFYQKFMPYDFSGVWTLKLE